MSTRPPEWITVLEPEDLNFIRRFVLASGSLKEMSEQYGVSYPTMRARVDALIVKLKRAPEEEPESWTVALIRELVADGEIEVSLARRLLTANRKDQEMASRRAAQPKKERS